MPMPCKVKKKRMTNKCTPNFDKPNQPCVGTEGKGKGRQVDSGDITWFTCGHWSFWLYGLQTP